MSDFTPLRERVDRLALDAPLPEFAELKQRAVLRRRRRRVAIGASVVAALIAVPMVITIPGNGHREPLPLGQSKPVIGEGPVWFDAQGLHRGDQVEQTPVKRMGALALVRTGAVYQDPATSDVWFQPWGGDPRVVGHGVSAGPGGDPEGDTAAWFEGSELVVYDTATGSEISRTPQLPAAANCGEMCAEHYPAGSNFVEVSAEKVIWTGYTRREPTITFDVSSQTTTQVTSPVIDVHGQVAVRYDWSGSGAIVVSVPGQATARYPALEPRARLSPDGRYVLGVESTKSRHAAAIVDVRSGEVFHVPKNGSPFISWSYGDTALVKTDDQFLACDASQRTCKSLPADGEFLMPTT